MRASKNNDKQKTVVLLSIAATFCLLVANSAFWVHRNFFNPEQFSNIATTSITSESSRQAIAGNLSNRLYEDRPVLKNVLGNTTTNILSGLLGTDQSQKALGIAIERLHTSVTSPEQESVVIDLSGIKSTASKLTAAINTQADGQRINSLPDEITLVDRDNIPDFYQYGVLFLWLGPIALVACIALLAWPYIKKLQGFLEIMVIQGGLVAISSALSLLIGPLVQPPLLARIADSNARTVTGNLYQAFIATFNMQLFWIIGLGFAVVLVGTGLQLRKNVYSNKK